MKKIIIWIIELIAVVLLAYGIFTTFGVQKLKEPNEVIVVYSKKVKDVDSNKSDEFILSNGNIISSEDLTDNKEFLEDKKINGKIIFSMTISEGETNENNR